MFSLLKSTWAIVNLLFFLGTNVCAFSNTRSLSFRQANLLPTSNKLKCKRSCNISKLKLSETITGTNGDDLEVDLTPLSSSLDATPNRWISSLPSVSRGQYGDELDHRILSSALPSMLNMAVVPIVNAVDTFWVGRMGITLALAGQSAANQAFFTLFFLVSFLPTITAPLVATAVGSGDMKEAQNKVCEALFLSNVLGGLGTVILVCFPKTSLGLVLSKDAAAMSYAIPYLRYRALSMIPALISSTGFAAYRGLLNTVTPLKVSLFTNLVNLLADPFFVKGMGVSGAAIATAGAETLSGLIYIRLLMRQNLVRLSSMFKVPSWDSIKTIIQGGSAMLLFQLAINVAFVTAARKVQAMDPTGVAAAAYGIVMQIYSVGVVMHLGIKATAATLVPSERSKKGDDAARAMADRLFVWGTIVGLILGFLQMALLPFLIP
jgi:putative MATE family efflux protein